MKQTVPRAGVVGEGIINRIKPTTFHINNNYCSILQNY